MTAQTAHDPICHMDIDPATASATSDYQGATYYFCAPGCKSEFDRDPAAALRAEAEHDHGGGHHMMAMHESGATASGKKAWWQFWKG